MNRGKGLSEIEGKAVRVAAKERGQRLSFKAGTRHLSRVAVVQGSVTEKRTDRGQDTSGHGSWMDVFVKRGDKWVIVRSHSSWVKSAN